VSALPLLDVELMRHALTVKPSAAEQAAAAVTWRGWLRDHGYKTYRPLLASGKTNVKISKGGRTMLLTLRASNGSGVVDVCAHATVTCRAVCVLETAGKGGIESVRDARDVRTMFAAAHPRAFLVQVWTEVRAAARRGVVRLRLNMASDIRWELVAPAVLALRNVRTYDYSKYPPSARALAPASYRITYSFDGSERSRARAVAYLAAGGTVAVVFAVKRGQPLPAMWEGFPVVDGDLTDDRTRDPRGVVVGLRAKGSARRETPGRDSFVQAA